MFVIHRHTKDDEDDRQPEVIELAIVQGTGMRVRPGGHQVDPKANPVEDKNFVSPAGHRVLSAGYVDICLDIRTKDRPDDEEGGAECQRGQGARTDNSVARTYSQASSSGSGGGSSGRFGSAAVASG